MPGRGIPVGLVTHGREWGLVALVATVYGFLRGAATPETAVPALVNAEQVVALEAQLRLFVEQELQQIALDQAWLAEAAGFYYVQMHLPPVALLLGYTYLRRPDAWPLVRDTMFLVTIAGGILHLAYPLAPPWYVDAVPVETLLPELHGKALTNSALGNRFAAMPSMHFAWALAAGAGLAAMLPHRGLKILAAAHPVAMGLTIVVTGSHYVLDALASSILVGLAFLLARHLHTRWPVLGEPPWRRGRSEGETG